MCLILCKTNTYFILSCCISLQVFGDTQDLTLRASNSQSYENQDIISGVLSRCSSLMKRIFNKAHYKYLCAKFDSKFFASFFPLKEELKLSI